MEALFIFEPIATAIYVSLFIIAVSLLIALLPIGLGGVDFDDDGDYDDFRKGTKYKTIKGIIIASLVCFALIAIISPFTQPMDIYRKILIYRGINSALVDKTINTADKALDVLNLRLETELNNIKAEKE